MRQARTIKTRVGAVITFTRIVKVLGITGCEALYKFLEGGLRDKSFILF